MDRALSLAYLSSHRCTPAQAMAIAAEAGYAHVGLRLWPNAPGAPQQHLIDQPDALRETLAVQRDTGIGVLDLEIIRIGPEFDPHHWDALYTLGAQLQARAILVAGDDMQESRLSDNYARLCEVMRPYGLSADLEFMPWTAVRDANTALRVLRQADWPSNAGILVDALHFGRSHTSLEDIRAIPRGLLHYAQICDAQAGLDFSTEQMVHTARCARDLPGEGTIDLPGLFDALPADLPVSIEVVHLEREAQCSPLEWARQCLRASLPYLQPA